MVRYYKLATIAVFFLLLLSIPSQIIPIEGISVTGHRVLAIFLLATILWVTELVPSYTTSLLIIGLLTLIASDSAPFFLRDGLEDNLILDYQAIFSTLAAPVVVLFLGGFFIAIAATKYKLDINLARILLKPIGSDYSRLMLGLMGITAIFSMFMSNTATTAMMLTLLTPLLSNMDSHSIGTKGMIIAVPIAANIGGIGTPIGTPPNAIAFRYLTGEDSISFGGWMLMGMPLAILLVFIAWYLIRKIYPTDIKSVLLEIDCKFEQSTKAWLVYITVATTVLLWITSNLHGINSYSVALIPIVVFTLTGIINTEDIKQLNWDVLWLIAGGIAMGYALEQSGLAQAIVQTIPFETMSPLTVLLSLSYIAMVMATFMSNTATANLLMPIVVSIATAMTSLEAYGGLGLLVVCVALSASMGMSLPISTPPNALAHATGLILSQDFIKIGKYISTIGVLLIVIITILLGLSGYL